MELHNCANEMKFVSPQDKKQPSSIGLCASHSSGSYDTSTSSFAYCYMKEGNKYSVKYFRQLNDFECRFI